MFGRWLGDQLLGLLQPLGLGIADGDKLGPLVVHRDRLDVVAADAPATHQRDADTAANDRSDGVKHAVQDLAVHLEAVSDPHSQHQQLTLSPLVDHPVGTKPKSAQAFKLSLEG